MYGQDFDLRRQDHEEYRGVITQRSLDTDVQVASAVDLRTVLKENGWKFNWKTELRCGGEGSV